MAIKATDGLTAEWYTPESEKEDEAPTQFHLKPFNGEKYNYIWAELFADSEGDVKISGKGVELALKFGLIGWRNMLSSNNSELAFKPNNFKHIPQNIRLEIASHLIDISTLTDGDEKNS